MSEIRYFFRKEQIGCLTHRMAEYGVTTEQCNEGLIA
jgi:hypothetical protein